MRRIHDSGATIFRIVPGVDVIRGGGLMTAKVAVRSMLLAGCLIL